MSLSYPDEINDWIYTEIEARLGREATFEDYEKVVERLPERVSRKDIKGIVEKTDFNASSKPVVFPFNKEEP